MLSQGFACLRSRWSGVADGSQMHRHSATSVSVIIPTYNMGWCIERAIDSALSQGIADIEVIVVDDGSTDDTASRLVQYEERIVTVRQSNQGLSAARNCGIQKATGEFVAFLDADDLLLENKLKIQMAYLEAHPDCGAVFSDGYLVSPDGCRLNLISAESTPGLFAQQSTESIRQLLLRGHPFPPHAALVRRSCVLAVGSFDVSMRAREDLDFWLRLSERYPLHYVPGTLVHYTVRPDSLSRSSKLMFTYSTILYDRLMVSADFCALSRQEKAVNLRAWAMEVGVSHYGPWAKHRSGARTYAAQALAHDPGNWKSWVLFGLLCMPWCIRLAQRILAARTRRARRSFVLS